MSQCTGNVIMYHLGYIGVADLYYNGVASVVYCIRNEKRQVAGVNHGVKAACLQCHTSLAQCQLVLHASSLP